MTIYARLLAGLSALIVASAIIAAVVVIAFPERTGLATRPSSVGGPFRLTDQNNRSVTDADFKGKHFLVFFGFTHCPDICPTTLFEISEVLHRLGPDAERIAALFISVDPERDTPEKLKEYLSNFHPNIVGLSGTPAEIEAVVKVYRAYTKKVPLAEGGYTMDHTALVYLMDKDGRFVAPFNLRRTADAAAADLRRRL